MTRSSLKDRLARLGPPLDINRVSSGSPVAVAIRPKAKSPNAVGAVLALVRRGSTMLKAKRTIEVAMDAGYAALIVPVVEDINTLAQEMAEVGFMLASIATRPVSVTDIRDRLGLTQEQFALRFGIDLSTLRNWEQDRAKPNEVAMAYLRVIERDSIAAAHAQEEAPVLG